MEKKLEQLRFNLREKQFPYFDDEDLFNLLEKNNGDVQDASCEGLIIKSEDTSIKVSGLDVADNSSYFRRLASQYKRHNTGRLKD